MPSASEGLIQLYHGLEFAQSRLRKIQLRRKVARFTGQDFQIAALTSLSAVHSLCFMEVPAGSKRKAHDEIGGFLQSELSHHGCENTSRDAVFLANTRGVLTGTSFGLAERTLVGGQTQLKASGRALYISHETKSVKVYRIGRVPAFL